MTDQKRSLTDDELILGLYEKVNKDGIKAFLGIFQQVCIKFAAETLEKHGDCEAAKNWQDLADKFK
jgi:hypothetical protein